MVINRDTVIAELDKFLANIFSQPEVVCAKIRDVVIPKEGSRADQLEEAMDKSYHDCYSDVDLSIVVKRSPEDQISESDYMKQIERFGVNTDTCLGFYFVKENNMYRIIFKNGMRYDLGFEFEHDDNADFIQLEPEKEECDNPDWPMENVNRFWFVQIQALGKLYRKDFLISSHLAHMNLNETLVQQMILRDIEHGTNHHRYGYAEELIYMKYKDKCPIKTGNKSFDRIAEKIYCAAAAYDELTRAFYPEYEGRCRDFMEIWKCYDGEGIGGR